MYALVSQVIGSSLGTFFLVSSFIVVFKKLHLPVEYFVILPNTCTKTSELSKVICNSLVLSSLQKKLF